MQSSSPPRPRLVRYSRFTMWAVIGMITIVGLFKSSAAWAETTACGGNSTIPVGPLSLFLKFNGPASTYQISLCETPDAPVNIATSVSSAGKVAVSPATLALTSAISRTISVTVAAGHPANQPFAVVITHTASSTDPDFNYGSLNIPIVTAYYSPPLAVNDSVSTLHGQGITVSVLANDVDRLGQGISIPNGTTFTPASGTATLNANNSILYTPAAGFSGVVTFTYPIVDALGNTDTGVVFVSVANPNVTNPQVKEIDHAQGDTPEFESSLGKVQVAIPPLLGIPAGSTVAVVFGEVQTPAGDVTAAPIGGGTFAGIVLKLEVHVNGVPISPGQLSAPLKLSFVLPDEFVAGLNGARVVLAVWDGSTWVTEGVSVESLVETSAQLASAVPNASTLTINTTVFGEFALFKQHVLMLPSLERQ